MKRVSLHAEKLLKSWMKLLNLLEIWEVLDILVNMLRLMKLGVLLMNYNNKADLSATRGESEERKMFKLRVQYLDGQVNDVVADNNTLVLLETMMRYGIIARITCKLR